jgi:hypothetical protein
MNSQRSWPSPLIAPSDRGEYQWHQQRHHARGKEDGPLPLPLYCGEPLDPKTAQETVFLK